MNDGDPKDQRVYKEQGETTDRDRAVYDNVPQVETADLTGLQFHRQDRNTSVRTRFFSATEKYWSTKTARLVSKIITLEKALNDREQAIATGN